MMYEMKQVCKLKLQGLSDTDIKEKVIDENIFQYKKKSSLKRSFPYILKRINILDDKLRNMMVQEPFEVVKVINLYSILKTDQLFYEFMNEVVKEAFDKGEKELERKNVNVFFTYKAEQSEFVANLAESTVKRLKSAYMKVLIEVGIVKDLRSRELHQLLIDEQVRKHLESIGDKQFVEVMGE